MKNIVENLAVTIGAIYWMIVIGLGMFDLMMWLLHHAINFMGGF